MIKPRKVNYKEVVMIASGVFLGDAVYSEMIADKFKNGQSMKSLSREYELPLSKIEDRIREVLIRRTRTKRF